MKKIQLVHGGEGYVYLIMENNPVLLLSQATMAFTSDNDFKFEEPEAFLVIKACLISRLILWVGLTHISDAPADVSII